MFSKRHYEAIAKVIKEHNESFPDVIENHSYTQDSCSCELMILDLVWMLERDNPNFDRVRFIDACGLGIDAPEIITVS
jgi:hypothetical protein